MSVTFSIASGPVTSYRIGCGCERSTGVRIPVGVGGSAAAWRRAEAVFIEFREGRRSWFDGCTGELCPAYGPCLNVVTEDRRAELDVDVSQANARELLGVLGHVDVTDDGPEPLWFDTEAASSFLGRVLVAQAVLPVDAGLPLVRTVRVSDCGRPAGYMRTGWCSWPRWPWRPQRASAPTAGLEAASADRPFTESCTPDGGTRVNIERDRAASDRWCRRPGQTSTRQGPHLR